MENEELEICPDCGRKERLALDGICARCKRRKINAKNRNKEYIPYINLPEREKLRIDCFIKGQQKRRINKKIVNNSISDDIEVKIPDNENYYQSKAQQIPIIMHSMKNNFNPLLDQSGFISILKDYDCKIPEENLKEILNVLLATDKLKDIFTIIVKDDNKQALLSLEQLLSIIEQKLQYNWESNEFREEDDIKFKGFLTWRRVLKEAILFWKQLYEAGTITEIQKIWNNDNEVLSSESEEVTTEDITQKKFQITTESISTIFNTRRPFTRVFYASTKEEAYEQFLKWMTDRQLHEDKSKTIITELNMEGENGEKKEN